jgi:YHS domain-containing protein
MNKRHLVTLLMPPRGAAAAPPGGALMPLAFFPCARRRLLLAAAGLVTLMPLAAMAAPPINTLKGGLLGGRGDTAILGYDPVAYFTQGKAVKGQDAFTLQWMGATWKFASQDHLDAFRANPEKFAPQYGGYCAYGVAQGYLVKIEPEQFRIIDGKLYLNYDADVQRKWLADTAGYIRTADDRIAALLSK